MPIGDRYHYPWLGEDLIVAIVAITPGSTEDNDECTVVELSPVAGREHIVLAGMLGEPIDPASDIVFPMGTTAETAVDIIMRMRRPDEGATHGL